MPATIKTSSVAGGPAPAKDLARIFDLLQRGRPKESRDLAEQIAAMHVTDPNVLALAAESCRVLGDLNAAHEWLHRAVEAGQDPVLMLKEAWLLSELRRRDEIPALAARIASMVAGNDRLLWQLGQLYYHHGMLDQAIVQFETVRALIGDHPTVLYDLGIARFYSGQFDRAEQDLDSMLAAEPQAGPALYLRSKLRKQSGDRNHVLDIQARLNAGFARAEDQGAAWHALAKELEDLGRYKESFAALRSGAKVMRGTLSYDIAPVLASLDEIRHVFDADAIESATAGCDEEGAIFIVGMPRTGTTLVERILTQSGKVVAAGELMDFGSLLTSAVQHSLAKTPGLSPTQAAVDIDFAAIGRDYMRGARQMAGGATRFIDKLPANYMYCGMIRRALPNARIIHLVRDPLDSCYAIFKTLFFGAYDFSYDLDELGEYYIAYFKMMRHWHDVMPDCILDVCYEDLVADTERQARRIYEWCGLEWTPDALDMPSETSVFATASSAQVREPVHGRSVRSSEKYADELAALSAKLAAAGVTLGSTTGPRELSASGVGG